MKPKFQVKDFVWAKMLTHPYWPAIIIAPTPNVPKQPTNSDSEYHWVYFFASHDYQWIPETCLKPYAEYKDRYKTQQKDSMFNSAVDELEMHLKEKLKNPNYEIIPEEFIYKESKKRPRSVISESHMRVKNTKKKTRWCEVLVLEKMDMLTSQRVIGVIGIGFIGSTVVKNLVKSGHKVNIWNRVEIKCKVLHNDLGHCKNITVYSSARSILSNSDLVFICMSDHTQVKLFIQNNFGMNSEDDSILKDKGIIVMTSMDPETSKDLNDMVEKKGGKYLEAMIQWSHNQGKQKNNLILIIAGDENLYFNMQSCLKAISCSTFYMGEVGYASKVYLVLQLIKGVCLSGLVEGMLLAQRCGISIQGLCTLLKQSQIGCSFLLEKAIKISEQSHYAKHEQRIDDFQKDLKLGLEISNSLDHYVCQPLFASSMVNEILKHCCKIGYGAYDVSAMINRNKY